MAPLWIVIACFVGIGLFGVGFLAGRIVSPTVPASPPKPVCGCQHGLNMHGTDGKCHEVEMVPVKWDIYQRATAWKERACGCQKYVGPKPVEELFTTPILPPEIET